MTGIEENTVDLEVHVYVSPREWEYRWKITPEPEFPETVRIDYQELAYYDNRSNSAYENKGGGLSFDKETWEKIKYAVDTVFEKSV